MPVESKRAVITFLGNAYHDSRVVNLIESLNQNNFDTVTVSFDWKSENFNTQIGPTSIYKLDKSKSSLFFYLKFLYLLTRDLMRHRAEVYFAEDIYTLPITYFFSKIYKGRIFYNSREIYAHLAGLRNKNYIQRIISKIESKFIKKVDLVLVTGEMDAQYLREAYEINNFLVLRNLPKYQNDIATVNLREKLNIPVNSKILLYQGVLLEGRGIIKVIEVLDSLQDLHFVIVGDGEFKEKFLSAANSTNYAERIHFLGAVNHFELLKYTAGADIGLALIENISISYYYALPNKLFEYIMAGLPVLVSNLPQMKRIVDKYNVGKAVDPENRMDIIGGIKEILTDSDKLDSYKLNCSNAAKELNWEKEFQKLKVIISE